jgi:APA family basic amino acid/polyamine antiporter
MMSYQDFYPLGNTKKLLKLLVAYAFDITGQAWAGYIITIAATIGFKAVLMVMIMGQSKNIF